MIGENGACRDSVIRRDEGSGIFTQRMPHAPELAELLEDGEAHDFHNLLIILTVGESCLSDEIVGLG